MLHVQNNEKSLCSSSGVGSQAPKRQKLDGGHLHKVQKFYHLQLVLSTFKFCYPYFSLMQELFLWYLYRPVFFRTKFLWAHTLHTWTNSFLAHTIWPICTVYGMMIMLFKYASHLDSNSYLRRNTLVFELVPVNWVFFTFLHDRILMRRSKLISSTRCLKRYSSFYMLCITVTLSTLLNNTKLFYKSCPPKISTLDK